MQAAEVTVRDMLVADLPSVIEIENMSFTQRWSFNDFISEVLHHDSTCKVACNNRNDVTGFICIRTLVDEVHILKLAVVPAYRRRYVGSALVKHVTGEMATTSKVILEVRVSNIPAIRFYDSLGFKALYTRRRYYVQPEEDAVVMAYDG